MPETLYKALSNPVRLKIIDCLKNKDLTVTEIIGNCGLSQSAVSQHLTILKESGLVEDSKSGRQVYYSLKHKKAAEVYALIKKLQKELQK